MKTSVKWVSFGVIVAGLLHGPESLRAQPASEPAPTDSKPVPTGDEPPSPSDKAVPTGGEPGPVGSKPTPIDEGPLVTGDSDKPWSRGVPVENRTAARELFREGNRLFRIPLFSRAAEKYSAALSIWKHPAFYFNLALAQINTGQEVEAKESLERAMVYGAQPLGEDRFQEAQRQLKVVMRQLGQIRLVCRTPGAEVTLDGTMVLVGPGSYEGWIKAKSHELTAKKPGYQSDARRVTVPSGQLLTVDLTLLTLSRAADASRRWAVWKPWAVVGAGIAVAAGGGVLHAVAARNFNIYDDKFSTLVCAQESGCSQNKIEADAHGLNDRLIRAERQQVIAVGSYMVSGLLISAGVVLLYLNRPRLVEQERQRFLSNVAVVPMTSDNIVGILVNASY